MENQEVNQDKKQSKTVSWFLHKNSILELTGNKGIFCKSFVANGAKLADGTDISNYTFTFSPDRVQDIKVNENSPDFIKNEKFKENFKSVKFFDDWKLTLTEPYDKANPDKELKKVVVSAKELQQAQKTAYENRAVQKGKDKDRCFDRAKNTQSPQKDNQEKDAPDIDF